MWDLLSTFVPEIILYLTSSVRRAFDRKREWSGTVDKKIALFSLGLSERHLIVVFRTDEGRKKKIRMSQAESDRYGLQARVFKRAGADLPEPHAVR